MHAKGGEQCRSVQQSRAGIPAARSSPTSATARCTRKLRLHAIASTSATQRLTAATTRRGSRYASGISRPTRCVRTARKQGGSRQRPRCITSNHSRRVVRMMRATLERCVSPATLGSPRWMVTGGGKPHASTRISEVWLTTHCQ